MLRADREPGNERVSRGKDKSKDPLISRSEFVGPSVDRGCELEMGNMVPDTGYQPAYHPSQERGDTDPQQQAMEQWHRTGW